MITEEETKAWESFSVVAAIDGRWTLLGAWGCGAFGNNPKTTALDFKYSLQNQFKGAFETVKFAVYDPLGYGENLTSFQSEFISNS